MKTNIQSDDLPLRFRKEPTMNIRLIIVTILALFAAVSALPTSTLADPGDLYATLGGFRILKYSPNGAGAEFAKDPLQDGTDIIRPRGLVFDGSGDLFVSTLDTSAIQDDRGRILEFTPPFTSLPVTAATQVTSCPSPTPTPPDNCMDNPQQIVFDSKGNLYAASAGVGNSGSGDLTCAVYMIKSDGTVTTFATVPSVSGDGNLHQLFGLVVDDQDNLFVADAFGTIYEIPTTGTGAGVPIAFATFQFNPALPNIGPVGLAFDASGNLFASTFAGDGSVRKIPPGTPGNPAKIDTTQPPFATISADTDLRGLAFDAQGKLFVAGHGTNQIYKVSSDGTLVTPFGGAGSQYFAFAPGSNTTTSAGLNVITNAGTVGFATIALTFPSVTTSGTTTVTPVNPSAAGYTLPGSSLGFDITTTAAYPTPVPTPPGIVIAFQVARPLDASQLTVLHNEGGSLVNVTCPSPRPGPTPDTTTNTIYASVTSLSPFVVAKLPFTAQVQPPINSDGTSAFSVKRGVVPVQFTLIQNGTATCTLPPATIALTRTAGGTTGAVNESTYVMPSDTGPNFRIDSCQYVYNLNSSGLGVGIYRVDIKINGVPVGSGIFQVK
jgi:sugar lactone lactonase YvrE